jgi:hypothetical protein
VPEGVPQAGGVAGGQRRAQGSVLATSWVRGAAMADESSTPGLSALMRTGRGSPEGRVPRPVTELTAWSTASGATFLTLCSSITGSGETMTAEATGAASTSRPCTCGLMHSTAAHAVEDLYDTAARPSGGPTGGAAPLSSRSEPCASSSPHGKASTHERVLNVTNEVYAHRCTKPL